MADTNVEQNPAAGAAGAGENGNTPNSNAPGGEKPVAGTGNAGGSNDKVYSFKEDRSDWVPRSRLNEVSSKLTKLEQETLTYKQQLELSEKRTRALAGLEPQDPKAEQTEQIREALENMFPGLKAIKGLSPEQLEEVFETARQARSVSQQASNRHAEAMLNELDSEATRQLGVDKLTPSQQKNLWRAYREALIDAAGQRPRRDGSNESYDPTGNDALSRHERGDKTLLKEFVKNFLNDWYEPARRSVTTSQASRNLRPVPRGDRGRTLPTGAGGSKIDLNNKEDFKKALIAARGDGQA